MSDLIAIIIDGVEVKGAPGTTILAAAEDAGIYVPRLCHLKGIQPHGSCRVCTVMVNGRPQAACTTPISPGMVIENDTERMLKLRRDLIDMLFVEGNHFCMFCEMSGNCELQALAYRFGITAPKYPYQFPARGVDGSHPDLFIDGNRCILCGRCARTAQELDGKSVLGFVGRGPHKRLRPSAAAGLQGTAAAATDKMATACPVGALVRKRTGYAVPVGKRRYDTTPIGSEIEARRGTRG